MRGCLTSTLMNILGAFLVVIVVAFLGNVIFAQLPWQVTSQESAEVIQSIDILSDLNESGSLPKINTSVHIEIVPELTPKIALTNSILLLIMTATFSAFIFILVFFLIVYSGYELYMRGMADIGGFIETVFWSIGSGIILTLLGPLLIWFTLLLQEADPLYHIFWVVVGLPALLLGYGGVYYGAIGAQWLGKQIITIFSFPKIFKNQNAQIGAGLILLVLLAFSFIAIGQMNLAGLFPDGLSRQVASPPSECEYIDYESVIEGQITSEQEDIYCFTGQSGSSIAIRVMEAQRGPKFTLYPSLTLYDPDGYALQRDGAEREMAYAQVVLQDLTEEGTYWIRIEGTENGGTYWLRLERGPKAGMGDVNRDCQVDERDQQLIKNAMGTRDNPDLDLDLNGIVESRDMVLFNHQKGTQCQ